MLENLELYVVRNKKGQWFRAKGYQGTGNSWVDDINKAKIYTKLGQAKSRVTYFATHHPSFGVPEVVKLIVSKSEVMPMEEHVQKAKKAKETAEKRRKVREAEWKIKELEASLKRNKEELEAAKTLWDKKW